MLVAFLMTLYAGILSPLDSGLQSTDINSTLAAPASQVQEGPGRKPCDVAWPFCEPPHPKAIASEPATTTANCGNVAWPDACPLPNAQAAEPAGQPNTGRPGGIEWPGSAVTLASHSRLPINLNPGVEWPS